MWIVRSRKMNNPNFTSKILMSEDPRPKESASPFFVYIYIYRHKSSNVRICDVRFRPFISRDWMVHVYKKNRRKRKTSNHTKRTVQTSLHVTVTRSRICVHIYIYIYQKWWETFFILLNHSFSFSITTFRCGVTNVETLSQAL